MRSAALGEDVIERQLQWRFIEPVHPLCHGRYVQVSQHGLVRYKQRWRAFGLEHGSGFWEIAPLVGPIWVRTGAIVACIGAAHA